MSRTPAHHPWASTVQQAEPAAAAQGTRGNVAQVAAREPPRAALQRQRLQAAFGRGAQRPVVQAYARVPQSAQRPGYWDAGADLRVSDDGLMALADGSKQFWARADVIAQTESALMALGSPFMFTVGDQTLEGRVPGRKPGAPVLLNRVVPVNTLGGSMGDQMRTIEACSSHGQQLLGAGLERGEHNMARGMAVVTGRGADEAERRYDKRGAGGQARTDTQVMGDVRAEVTGRPRGEAEEAYGDMPARDKDARARELGINQYAEPQVGEGLAVYAAVDSLKRGSFPMHFAGVVARSGGDYVTLENYAKGLDRKPGDSNESSNDWTVKMYGPVKDRDDQSFFGELASNEDYGGRKGVMVLRHRPVDGFPMPSVVAEVQPVVDGCLPFVAQSSPRQYPAFHGEAAALRRVLQALKQEVAVAWTEGREPSQDLQTRVRERALALADTGAGRALMRGQAPMPEVPDLQENRT